MENIPLGTFIKRIRLDRNISRDELSKRIGVAINTLRGWEMGLANPRAETLPKIAAALNMSLEDLENRVYTSEDNPFGAIDSDFTKATLLASQLVGLFAGGELTDRDKDAVMYTLQRAYVTSKKVQIPDEDAEIWKKMHPEEGGSEF